MIGKTLMGNFNLILQFAKVKCFITSTKEIMFLQGFVRRSTLYCARFLLNE